MYVVAHRARCESMYSVCLSAVEGVGAGRVGAEGEDGGSKKTVQRAGCAHAFARSTAPSLGPAVVSYMRCACSGRVPTVGDGL